jgi:hypothetical protein
MPAPLTLETRVGRNPSLVATEMDGDLVMLHVERGQYFGVGRVGRRVWEALESSPCAIAQLCAQVQAEFEVDETQCRADMLEFVGELLDKDLLRAL